METRIKYKIYGLDDDHLASAERRFRNESRIVLRNVCGETFSTIEEAENHIKSKESLHFRELIILPTIYYNEI